MDKQHSLYKQLFLKYNRNSKIYLSRHSRTEKKNRFHDKCKVLAQTFRNVLNGVGVQKKEKKNVVKTCEAFVVVVVVVVVVVFVKHD